MADKFVYKGMPIIKNGIVVAVKRIRGVEAEDGNIYHGVLDVDAHGNKFSYNRVPDDYLSVMPILFGILDADGNRLFDSDEYRLMVRK